MEVILLDKVENLGKLGDKVKVRPGYARNYLLPQGKAVRVTEENLASFEARRAELERLANEELAAARTRAEQVQDVELTVAAKSGENGKLFGSIGPVDVIEALEARGVTVERSEVRMPEGPIRSLGEYEIGLHFHSDVDVAVKLNVVAESAENEETPSEDAEA